MPFYEYACNKCAHELEELQKISDEPLKKCPACGKLALEKKVSAAAFRLKGGGWYETDFKSGNKKNLHVDAKKAEKKSNKDSNKTKKTTGNSTQVKKTAT